MAGLKGLRGTWLLGSMASGQSGYLSSSFRSFMMACWSGLSGTDPDFDLAPRPRFGQLPAERASRRWNDYSDRHSPREGGHRNALSEFVRQRRIEDHAQRAGANLPRAPIAGRIRSPDGQHDHVADPLEEKMMIERSRAAGSIGITTDAGVDEGVLEPYEKRVRASNSDRCTGAGTMERRLISSATAPASPMA